jgi:tetratricopeptide (TPR) repeat protein
MAALVAVVRPCAAQDPITLAQAGTRALDAQRFAVALDAFTKAAALRPDDASLCFGAGLAAFMLGQDATAQSRFECALVRNPNYVTAATWLGDLHYRAGRLREAIATYEAAQRRAPKNTELRQKLANWRKEFELQSRFREVRTAHFSALFELDADEPLVREAVDRLELAYERIGTALGLYPTDTITVVLYSREQFDQVTGLASWSAAAYDGRIRVPLSDVLKQSEELDRVLTHEFVHAVVARLGGRTVPTWLSEGLATVLEPAGSGDVEALLRESAATPPLSRLHGKFTDFSRQDARIAYASSARAVRHLVEQHGMPALVALLQDLARGEPFADAFRQRISMRYDEFASLLEQH